MIYDNFRALNKLASEEISLLLAFVRDLSLTLFLYFRLFKSISNKWSLKISDDWILNADLWRRTQALFQLCNFATATAKTEDTQHSGKYA